MIFTTFIIANVASVVVSAVSTVPDPVKCNVNKANAMCGPGECCSAS